MRPVIRHPIVLAAAGLGWLLFGINAEADPIFYSSRSVFSAALGQTVLDDYSAPGYRTGDVTGGIPDALDIHSDAHMSGVLGQTRYITASGTGNAISNEATNARYGSSRFTLVFTETSLGSRAGVFGVGFDFLNLENSDTGPIPHHAVIAFGDGSTSDVALPFTTLGFDGTPGFFGVTSGSRIASINIGGPAGVGAFALDNLAIGAEFAPTPEPSTLILLGSGMIGLYRWQRWRHNAKSSLSREV